MSRVAFSAVLLLAHSTPLILYCSTALSFGSPQSQVRTCAAGELISRIGMRYKQSKAHEERGKHLSFVMVPWCSVTKVPYRQRIATCRPRNGYVIEPIILYRECDSYHMSIERRISTACTSHSTFPTVLSYTCYLRFF